MSEQSQPVQINLINKEYQVLCPPAEIDALTRAALFLDKKMREVKNSGKVLSTEQIAVITALNLANELLKHDRTTQDHTQFVREQIQGLQDKLDEELAKF